MALGRVKNLKWKILPLAIYGVALGLWRYLKLPCLWRSITGIICPGCGMSRAWLAVLHLDFSKAFSMHPMFWSVPLLIAYVLYDGRLFRRKWVNYSLLGLILGGFALCYILRLSGWNSTI